MTIGLKGQTGDFFAKFELDAEHQDETIKYRGEIFSVHGKANLGDFAVGGFASYSDKEAADADSYTYVASVKYSLTDKLASLATGNIIDADVDSKDAEWVVVGTEYKYARNIKLAAEVAMGDVLKNAESGALGYAKIYYWF